MPAAPARNTVRPRPRPASESTCRSAAIGTARPTGVGTDGRGFHGTVHNGVAQGDRLFARAHAELALQRPVQPLELAQGGTPVPARGVLAHQRQVGLGVGRVGLDQLGPAAGLAQHPQLQQVQPVAGRLGPRLVAVVGQQLPAVPVGGGRGRDGITAVERVAGQLLEPVGVHGHRAVREQQHVLLAQRDAVRAERPPREVGRLVQPGHRLGRRDVRPQRVHHLLAVQLVPRRERQYLDQARRLPTAPGGRGDLPTVDPHVEPPEQEDVHAHP
jgi:hypothetical protein